MHRAPTARTPTGEQIFADVADDRGCTECTCGDPTGTCGGNVAMTEGACTGIVILDGNVAVPGCANASGANRAHYTATIDASCAPQGGTATGSATPTGAVTLCCFPG